MVLASGCLKDASSIFRLLLNSSTTSAASFVCKHSRTLAGRERTDSSGTIKDIRNYFFLSRIVVTFGRATTSCKISFSISKTQIDNFELGRGGGNVG